MTLLFLTGFMIVAASLIGVVFTIGPLAKWSEKNFSFLTSFAAGVFLVTAAFLIREVVELAPLEVVISSTVGGFLIFLILQHVVPESHHHHHDEHCKDPHTDRSAFKILLGDALHNIGDGIILVPAFSVDIELGVVAAVSILIHEMIQEISEYFVLRKAGYSTKKALTLNFFVAMTLFIGIAIGFWVATSNTLQAVLLGISAGAFIQIVFHDLLPHGDDSWKGDKAWLHGVAFSLGVLSIVAVNWIVPHQDVHGDDHHNVLEEGHYVGDGHGH